MNKKQLRDLTDVCFISQMAPHLPEDYQLLSSLTNLKIYDHNQPQSRVLSITLMVSVIIHLARPVSFSIIVRTIQ